MDNPNAPAPGALSRLGLRGRAVLLMAVAFAVAALLAYFVLVPRVSRSFEEQVSARGAALAGVLEQHQALRLALSLSNEKDATKVAQELLVGDKDLTWVVLLDGNDKVLGKAMREGALPVEEIVQRHLGDKKGGGKGVIRGEGEHGQRFTRVIERSESKVADDLALFADVTQPAQPPKPLGTVLLGLSAKEARARLALQSLVTIGITSGLIAVVFLVFFSRIAGRLRRMSHFAAQVAGGDLAGTLSDRSSDEIGQLSRSLEEMTRKTGGMVGRLQDAAQSLARVASELLTSSSQQGEAATRQAASVAETGATVAELRETFNQAAERAQLVIDLARRSEESTTSGKDSVEESVAAMEQIKDQVASMSRTIQSLVERTNQIGTIIDAVNDLAEQSNVLALNAAIEAAKAGEHGRGFAVVAREVRSLAERSKDSTAQVRFILKDIEKATREAMGSIDEGTRKTQSGMELANRAGESIGHLDKAINDSSTAAKQIAASTRQQAVGVDQIWQAMRDIDRAVNESASGIRQIEDASRNMKTLSEEMAQLVKAYTVAR